MIMIIEAFYLLAVLSLLDNTHLDFKIQEIDSRWNWLMFGALFMLLMILGMPLIPLIFMLLTAIFSIILVKFDVITLGDFEALIWIVPALGMKGSMSAFVFIVGLLVAYVLSYTFMLTKSLKKNKKNEFNVPFYPIILISFVFAVIL